MSNTTMDGSLFQVRASPNSIPPAATPSTFATDRQYYNSLLPTEEIPYKELMQGGNVHVSISVSINRDGTVSTSSWLFHSPLVYYSSGHTQKGQCTRDRAALCGILMALYIVYKAEQIHPLVTPLFFTLKSGHKRAPKEAIQSTPIGVTTTNQQNYDLILDIRYFQNLLSSVIQPLHSPTAVEDSNYPIQYTPLSLEFTHNPSTRNHAAALDTTPLLHVIDLVQDNTVFTGDIKTKNHDLECCKQLQAKVQKDNHWTDNNFQMVDWDAYNKGTTVS
jgi:hypothetical protein